MKIVIINGSPKVHQSASRVLAEDLSKYLVNRAEIVNVEMHKETVSEENIENLSEADAWVFVYPLYVDGIPGHLLSCFTQLEKADIGNPDLHVYGIVNSGFYEGIQNKLSLEVLQNWSLKAGIVWGGGLGVGGGGSLLMLPKIEYGPKAPIYRTLESLSEAILQKGTQENYYVSVDLPRFVYKIGAQSSWRKKIKSNGRKTKDLGKIPE